MIAHYACSGCDQILSCDEISFNKENVSDDPQEWTCKNCDMGYCTADEEVT